MSTSTEILAAKIAPKIVVIVDPKRDEYIERFIRNPKLPKWIKIFPLRKILIGVWPALMDEIPLGTRDGLEVTSEVFGEMNLNDLLQWLSQNARLSPMLLTAALQRLKSQAGED